MDMSTRDLSPGDEWPHHYRGLALQVSPDKDVWWQLYQGTDRLHLDPTPTEVVEKLLEYKRIGGRIHVTEGGAVLTRVEQGDDEYKQLYLGETTIKGELIPLDRPEYSIEIRPGGLTTGDLWPSIYDGGRYSFVEDRIWWQNGATHRRHPVTTELPSEIMRELRSHKPRGGSFRITPWGDVITLIDMHPAPDTIERQFADLPRVVKNIIRLRKDKDVEMLPVYIGSIEDPTVEVEEPKTLTDKLSDDEMEELSSWAKNLGRTEDTSASSHKATSDEGSINKSASTQSQTDAKSGEAEGTKSENADDRPKSFDDDPLAWIEQEARPDRDQQ